MKDKGRRYERGRLCHCEWESHLGRSLCVSLASVRPLGDTPSPIIIMRNLSYYLVCIYLNSRAGRKRRKRSRRKTERRPRLHTYMYVAPPAFLSIDPVTGTVLCSSGHGRFSANVSVASMEPPFTSPTPSDSPPPRQNPRDESIVEKDTTILGRSSVGDIVQNPPLIEQTPVVSRVRTSNERKREKWSGVEAKIKRLRDQGTFLEAFPIRP